MAKSPFKFSSTLILELLAVTFMGSIALAASLSGVALVLFPELAAMTNDVLIRPDGKWAREPLRLILAPTLAAAFGLFCARHLHYAVWNILLIVSFSLIMIGLLRSTMSPSISAGVLPLVLGEHSWLYPIAIFLDLSALVLLLLVRKRYLAPAPATSVIQSKATRVEDELEGTPRTRFWWVALMSFTAVVGAAAQYTGLRFLLFPPLIVMAYELFGHAEVPGWIKRPILLPLVCLGTAAIGVSAEHLVHPAFVAVIITVICSVVLLRGVDLHMPPALAIGVIPFIIPRPGYRYVFSVFVGSVVLTVAYLAFRRLQGLHTDCDKRTVRRKATCFPLTTQ